MGRNQVKLSTFDDSNQNMLSPMNLSGMFSPVLGNYDQKANITNHDLDSVLEKMSGSSKIKHQRSSQLHQDANNRP